MDIIQLEQEMPKTINVRDAAEIMGITPELLREFLKQDKFPFGTAVQLSQTEAYINARRFIKYMKGE